MFLGWQTDPATKSIHGFRKERYRVVARWDERHENLVWTLLEELADGTSVDHGQIMRSRTRGDQGLDADVYRVLSMAQSKIRKTTARSS